ncbi:SUMF1/EgtB/PvdO family nonheme iron enzyme [Chlorobium sp. BLA1]|uniref:SUMF1/EgtB/PvdO family nonheme iron enzyme n=1 Tax=Candidatus Chlorobium masyuteum TaxID=2716876 RepID=UPI00141F13F2|nr:SUMF1/EgtB/PvdO family nonheme iron enzyme [Candidatus Chlorobium masyuteum]NHQ60999.1 SUMF1/EgtB/PvdO family nonheme iron enzyme [Candidatus Chlorobium masyuteum]
MAVTPLRTLQPVYAASDSGIKKVKILVASPGDVDKERKIVEEVIQDWNIRNGDERNMVLEAVLWEKHAAPENRGNDEGPQPQITRQIVDDCDCAIGIFWNRIGTPTKIAPGGAVEEVQRMLTVLKRPVMLYFSDMPINPSKIDSEQKAKLDEFKVAMKIDGLVWEYNSRAKFRTHLSRHLDLKIREWFFTSGVKTTKKSIPTDEVLRRYQAILKEEQGYIRMLGMPGVESVKVNLNDDTFVPLRLSGKYDSEKVFSEKRASQESEHIFSPDEIMKRAFHDRRGLRMLLVIGDPGAGKTTLLKYYALCAMEDYTRLGFASPVSVFYLPLRELLRDEKGDFSDSLPVNLASWSAKHHQTIPEGIFGEWLNSDALVLLDGLDEISDTEERKAVCDWIDHAWSGFRKARFVVTSRATGYNKEEGIELAADYERADVQDFTSEQQERFLSNWFTAAFLKEPCEKGFDEAGWQIKQRAEAHERTIAIMAHLKIPKNRGLRQLAAIPMILQIMAILWKDRDYMPESRVKLYEAALDYLLEFRDKRRKIVPLLSASRARQVLGPVSLWMQERLEKDEAPKAEMHIEMQERLDTLDNPPTAEVFCDYLVKRAGLLVESAGKEYLFRHKSFREYLAGVQLKEDRSDDMLNTLVTHFGEDWWEEPLRFFIASVDANVFDAFMQKFFDAPQSEALTQKQQILLMTLIEEAKGKKIDALSKKLLDPATTVERQRVILDCLKTVGKSSALKAIGQFKTEGLAKNSDVADRTTDVMFTLLFGLDAKYLIKQNLSSVTTVPTIITPENLPESFRNPNEHNAEYILIRKGSYLDSETKEKRNVKTDLYFAKYPVTNRLYRSFISGFGESKAFRERLDEIAGKSEWDAGFQKYLSSGKKDLAKLFRSGYDEDRKFGGDDQPVVGVNWYAAKAYCLWLSLLEGTADAYRLPNEVEWQWAAGGRQGKRERVVRDYPWPEAKGEPNPKLANYGQNVGATTPVGSYPEGATPEGLYDMVGNVWEWTDSIHEKYAPARSLRGGSWGAEPEDLRCSVRGDFDPGDWGVDIGFRVVRSSPLYSS